MFNPFSDLSDRVNGLLKAHCTNIPALVLVVKSATVVKLELLLCTVPFFIRLFMPS